MTTTSPKERLAMLIAAAKQRAAASQQNSSPANEVSKSDTPLSASKPASSDFSSVDNAPAKVPATSGAFLPNARQQQAIDAAEAKKNFCLIGAAGTGKTTTVREFASSMVRKGIITPVTAGTDVLLTGKPGVVCISFTNVAVINIARNMPPDITCCTIHKLLEFKPEYYEVIDEEGNSKSTMQFVPTRNEVNPLPRDLTTVIVEESSMVGTELFAMLLAALPDPEAVQFIFLGDINQLPPIYDTAILGYKMNELPCIELVEVYRTAGILVDFAHHIKDGKTICEAELRSPRWNLEADGRKLTVKPWKKRLGFEDAMMQAAKFTIAAIEAGEFDPSQDMILTPYNKKFGTIELNKHVSQHLALKRAAIIYEVIAGFNFHYFAVGDKVLCNKMFGTITSISKNGSYMGKRPQQASIHLNRWGYNTEHHAKITDNFDALADIDSILAMAGSADISERKTQASHFIEVALEDGRTITATTAAEVNAILMAYALTVHKAQGSEWRKVYFYTHQSQATMISRELLYTGCTRARMELLIVCEPQHFVSGVRSQRIKGNTLAEKAEFFKGKIADKQALITEGEEA